jgi:hypothetical protein
VTHPPRPHHHPVDVLERERPYAHLLAAVVVLLFAGLGALVLTCARACALSP